MSSPLLNHNHSLPITHHPHIQPAFIFPTIHQSSHGLSNQPTRGLFGVLNHIKYKSLRIVKYLCENGSPNWRRAWQRNTDKLRDLQV